MRPIYVAWGALSAYFQTIQPSRKKVRRLIQAAPTTTGFFRRRPETALAISSCGSNQAPLTTPLASPTATGELVRRAMSAGRIVVVPRKLMPTVKRDESITNAAKFHA